MMEHRAHNELLELAHEHFERDPFKTFLTYWHVDRSGPKVSSDPNYSGWLASMCNEARDPVALRFYDVLSAMNYYWNCLVQFHLRNERQPKQHAIEDLRRVAIELLAATYTVEDWEDRFFGQENEDEDDDGIRLVGTGNCQHCHRDDVESRLSLRKSEMVRKSGVLFAANTLKAMSSWRRWAMRREDAIPTQ